MCHRCTALYACYEDLKFLNAALIVCFTTFVYQCVSLTSTMTNQYDEFLGHMWEEIRKELNVHDVHKIREIRDRADLESFIEDVRTQSHDYICQPRSKISKIRVRLQHVCAKLSEFLECYTGIAELAKGIHPKGGSLGYGVVSVLLMVWNHFSLLQCSLGFKTLTFSDCKE